MATPDITNYTTNQVAGTISQNNNLYLGMAGSSLYIWADNEAKLHRLTGGGTLDGGFWPVTIGIGSNCIGVTPDGSLVILAEYGQGPGSNKIVTCDTSTGTLTNYTNGSGSPTTHYVVRAQGNMYVQSSTKIYLTDVSSSGPYAGSIISITLTPGANTYLTADQSLPYGAVPLQGCTLSGSDNLVTLVNTSSTNYLPYSCPLSTPNQPLVAISGGITARPYGDIFAINGFSANSTTYDFLFLSNSSTGIVYQFTMSGTAATSVGSKIVPNTPTQSLNGSATGGDATNNMRLFVSNGRYADGNGIVTKMRNTGGSTGPISNSSAGGDPHVRTFSGENIIIVREKPFEYLDTHPLSFCDDGDLRTFIVCDCFSLKNDYDNFSDQLPEEHVRELITNLDDSYLKYVLISFGGKKYTLNMITLLLEDEGEAGGKGRDQTNVGSERIEKLDGGSISFSKIEFFSPGNSPNKLKSKYVVGTAFGKRTMNIEARDYSISIEFTRTGCIHLSDMYLEVSGERDPLSFGGVVVDGIVRSPIE